MDMNLIPTHELFQDLVDSRIDIRICEIALECNIHHYSGGQSTQERLNRDKEIIRVILAELARRGIDIQ